MPDLSFRVEGATVVPFAAVPMIAFQLRIKNAQPEETIHTIALRCQIQIETTRRRYTPGEQEQLVDLFGHPDRWSQTLRNLLWTHASVVVPAFAGTETVVDLQVPCTFDFNVAATKYFGGLSDGEIPLNFLFSGSVFYAQEHAPLQVLPVNWDSESRYKLTLKLWREMMDNFFPNSVWINLHRDVFERLNQFKQQRGLLAFEQALEQLLDGEMVLKS